MGARLDVGRSCGAGESSKTSRRLNDHQEKAQMKRAKMVLPAVLAAGPGPAALVGMQVTGEGPIVRALSVFGTA